MFFINYAAREINCKLVCYGPAPSEKSTNLQHIYTRVEPGAKGKLISLASETGRALSFDFLPLELGSVRGFKTRFHLYTVPGQALSDASRKLILRRVDGVVFIADSQIDRLESNEESLNDLAAKLAEQGQSLDTLPFVIQYNKRDLPDIVPVEGLQAALNPRNIPWFEATAIKGVGVFETLKGMAGLMLAELWKTTGG